jgi:hypothetical protein
MGQMHQAPGGPADAGRALPGFRWTLIPCGDAARPSDPSLAALDFRLRAWRRCALRLPAQGGSFHEPPPHGSPGPSHTLHRPTAGLGWRAGRLTRPCGASPSRVACGSHGKAGISLATPAASRGQGATRLQMGGGLQVVSGKSARLPRRLRCASPASTHASGQAVTISSPVGSPAAIPLRGTAVSVPPWPAASPLSFRDAPAETPRLGCRFLFSRKPPAPPAAAAGKGKTERRREGLRMPAASRPLCERIGGSTW